VWSAPPGLGLSASPGLRPTWGGWSPWLRSFESSITVRAKRLPTGAFPLARKDHALAVISRAFPGVIEDCGDALSRALMNAGLVIHPPLITMNAAPLEHFERWDFHKEGTQASTRRVTDALDAARIQALAMNEAARMVEEGVATADEIDKAIKYGFGFRFAVLGMLEFIDWGGGDILYYASRYLTRALGSERYAAPEIVERNMREGRIGLSTRQGFLDYEGLDVEAYRRDRLKAFVAMLEQLGIATPPVLEE
jgi:hypothetical protein